MFSRGAIAPVTLFLLVSAISWAGLARPLAAQHSIGPDEVRVSTHAYLPPASALHVKTTEVQLTVVVRDANGRPVRGLVIDDFRLFDSGQERRISGFSVETSASPPALSAYSKRVETATPAPPVAETAPPVTVPTKRRFIALFFDDIHGNSGDLGHARNAARRFVKEALGPADRVGVFTSSTDQVLDFTDDIPKILGAIERLNAHPRVSESGIALCPRITPFQAYQITAGDYAAFKAAYDEYSKCNSNDLGGNDLASGETVRVDPRDPATNLIHEQAEQTWQQAKIVSQASLSAIRSAVDRLGQMEGDRMLLLASAGFLSAELEREQDQIIVSALHAQVVINALDAKGLFADAPGRPLDEMQYGLLPVSTIVFESSTLGARLQSGSAAMANFAASTGGVFFHDNNDLDFGFYRLGVVPEVQYQLGFSPEDVKPDGSYHPLKVQIAGSKHYSVEARPGYFAPVNKGSTQQTPERRIDGEVISAENLGGIPASVTWRLQGEADGENDLLVIVHMDLKPLRFQKQDDREVQHLTFILALLDERGGFVTAKEGEMHLALRQDSFEKLEGSGINAGFTLEAAPGSYHLRVVATDAVEGKIYASSQPVVVR